MILQMFCITVGVQTGVSAQYISRTSVIPKIKPALFEEQLLLVANQEKNGGCLSGALCVAGYERKASYPIP